MRLVHTEIATLNNNCISVERIETPFLQCPFHSQPEYHSHPEVELLYVIEGSGRRIVNGIVEEFEAGDMVFLGSNVPHVWLCDPTYTNLYSKAILMYFSISKFEEVFRSLNEFRDISELLSASTRGICVHGETKKVLVKKLTELIAATGFEKIAGVLQILHILSQSNDLRYILHDAGLDTNNKMPDQLVAVINYIKDNLHNPITLSQVANIACMTEQSFCRFFRSRLKKSFSMYLKDQRMARACTLLVQSKKSISEIADCCGYRSFSHFCKVFKTHTTQSPFRYRQSIQTKREVLG